MPSNVPINGQHVSVELVLNGVPVKVTDQVVNFTAKPEYQTIETRPLGSTGVKLDKIPDGWSGQIEVARSTAAVDDLIDAYNAARNAGIPVLINISQAVSYLDGTSRRYVYPDVVLDFDTSARRGESVNTRIDWRCGTDRI